MSSHARVYHVFLSSIPQELADLAVEQMHGVIHTLVKKGTTSSLRSKVKANVTLFLV